MPPLLLLLAALAAAAPAPLPKAASKREQLAALSALVQKAPADEALRRKSIELALAIKPAPAVPEEAERRMARGAAAVAEAKEKAGYLDAAKEFEAATLAAPWWGDAYYNLGVAYDKAGKPIEALAALKLAVAADPASKDAKTLMYQVEFRADKARDPLSALAGAWYQLDDPKQTKADLATYWSSYSQDWSLVASDGSATLRVAHNRWNGKNEETPLSKAEPVLTARIVDGVVTWEGLSQYGECLSNHRAPASVAVKENGAVLEVRLQKLVPARAVQYEGAQMRARGLTWREFDSKCILIDNFDYRLGRGE
jgi:tetratricopeptide (TPR) repeat protein